MGAGVASVLDHRHAGGPQHAGGQAAHTIRRSFGRRSCKFWDRSGVCIQIQREFLVFISNAFAQAAPAAATGSESGLLSMLPLVLMFVVLYFVMIRPQMKRQKEHKAMIDAIAKGDEVVTSGGMLGKISKVGDSYLSLEVAQGVELQVQRGAVVQVLPKGTIK